MIVAGRSVLARKSVSVKERMLGRLKSTTSGLSA
jgi:hypothetical protein